MEYRKSTGLPYVSMNLTGASIDDEISDPIVDAEAVAAEKELTKKMQKKKQNVAKIATSGGASSSQSAAVPGESPRSGRPKEPATAESKKLSVPGESTDSEGGADSGPFQSGHDGCSGHVISSPYELSHYPIEIQESKTALHRQISNRLNEVVANSTQQTTSTRACSSLGHADGPGQSLSTSSGAASKSTAAHDRRWSLQPHSAGSAISAKLESIREQLGSDSAGAQSPVEQNNGGFPAAATGGSLSPLRRAPASPSAIAFAIGQEKFDEIDRELCSPQHVEMHTFRDAIDVNYQRMGLTGEELSGIPLMELKKAAESLVKALRLRSEYMKMIGGTFPSTTRNFLNGKYPRELPKCRRKNAEFSTNMSYNPPEPPEDHWGLDQPLPIFDKTFTLERQHGNIAVLDPDTNEIVAELEHSYLSREKYLKDLNEINSMCNEGPLKTFCYRRLTFLQTHFQLHVLLNEQLESAEQRSVPHRDFYNIRKVDTHIHAASSMNHKHLLRFIKKKMRTDADEVVHVKNGRDVTMREVFAEIGISPYELTVDMLDVHADRNTFHRFDKFNAKYNPIGQNELREIFIKTDNYVDGRYFAQVLKEVLSDLEDSKYQQMEPRLSIYGRSKDEWDNLARWAIQHDVWSQNVRWMIQIPRLYDVYFSKNLIANFDVFLDNVFAPLFEVTNDPSSHPELHRFLQHVSGLDSVDDESKHEQVPFTDKCPEPEKYNLNENPAYSYYLYYMYSNLAALNAFRQMRGLNTFALRPHCGEAGHVSHLSVAYLTSESIAHGLLLRKVPVLQYLFYLTQIGMAMSPLSNNHLFLAYHRNPLPEFLMKGLNISLSTDDPLQFHITKEALMEEFSIAAQVWKLSSCDMCELARNSVLQSGFENRVKVHWLGPNYHEEGVLGNDVSRTNVPDIRVSFRHESLVNELCNLFKALSF